MTTVTINLEVPIPPLSLSNELALDGEGGLEGGLEDSEHEELEQASPKCSKSNNRGSVTRV